jgi:hypothetical protein
MRKAILLLFSLALAVAMGLGVACAKKPDDVKITGEIQGKFSQDSGLSAKQVTVQADNGVVTLAGVVDNEAQRDAASRQAASVAGVKEVVNNLQVGNAPNVAAAATGRTTQSSSADRMDRGMSDRAMTDRATNDRATTVVGRKSRKARAPADSDADHSSPNDANSQMSPDNLPDAPPQISEIPPNSTAAAQTAPPAPAAPRRLIIDQGTLLAVRLIDPIDSEKNQTGDTFHATLNASLTSDGEEAVPAGTEVTGHLVEVKSAGKFAGQSVVVLQLDTLSSGGKTYSLQTDQYRKEGKSRGENTAEKVGGGAIIGGIIGAIAGGGKGAAIGSAAGAGVGGGAQAASKSQQIKLPSETVLNFTLQAPITVVQVSSPDANRPKLGDSPQ